MIAHTEAILYMHTLPITYNMAHSVCVNIFVFLVFFFPLCHIYTLHHLLHMQSIAFDLASRIFSFRLKIQIFRMCNQSFFFSMKEHSKFILSFALSLAEENKRRKTQN